MANCIKCGKNEVVMPVICGNCVSDLDKAVIIEESLRKEERVCGRFVACEGCPLRDKSCYIDSRDGGKDTTKERIKIVLDWEENK